MLYQNHLRIQEGACSFKIFYTTSFIKYIRYNIKFYPRDKLASDKEFKMGHSDFSQQSGFRWFRWKIPHLRRYKYSKIYAKIILVQGRAGRESQGGSVDPLEVGWPLLIVYS